MEDKIIYDFDPNKNAWLIENRHISFEEIITVLETIGPIDVLNHPAEKYAHQKIYVIEIDDYAYLVPFVEGNGKIFLKTAFPNRDATKKYLKK